MKTEDFGRDIEKSVHEVVSQIIEQRGSLNVEIKNEHRLVADLGFESLDLAQLVAMLEIKLGVDPFANDIAITSIRRVADVIDAYSKSCANLKQAAHN